MVWSATRALYCYWDDEIARLEGLLDGSDEPLPDDDRPDDFERQKAYLSAIPDLEAWHAERREREAERLAAEIEHVQQISQRVRYLVENTSMPVAEAVALAQQPPELDPDTLALLDRAEAYLGSGDGESAA
jgi:hypothetical protein